MRLKTLNGAPLREHLDFRDTNLLDAAHCNEFRAVAWRVVSGEALTPTLKWRRLTPQNARLPTGWSQSQFPASSMHRHESRPSFSRSSVHEGLTYPSGTASSVDAATDFDEQSPESNEFLRHSIIFHDSLLSSQVLPGTGGDDTISSPSFLGTSFGTSISRTSSEAVIERNLVDIQVHPSLSITPLATLPSASHLRSIYPQTPTPNLIVVLMTSPERREVIVRKGGYKMDLWEINAADDTSSGFKISFWVRPNQESNNDQANIQNLWLQALQQLNPGDILLLRNVALTAFRDTVYGQSLSPTIARARTSIDMLMKSSGITIGDLSTLPVAVVEKFEKVKRWARTHVATGSVGSRKRKPDSKGNYQQAKRSLTSPEHEGSLPPDTLEAV